jgi:3'-phosphoadenosine 5'-phosphosulfate sulfotransferase (PAPS reductase)/FAD synthetase
MSNKKINDFKNAIKSGNKVSIYFVIGKSGGGFNEIEYRAQVLDIASLSGGMKTPDERLTPDVWRNIENSIWIKISNLKEYNLKSVNDFEFIKNHKVLKDVLKTDKQPKCVVFEGVRSDESARRETYKRVGEGVKHINLINCRPIFYWNETEVFLYILCRSQVKLNEGYTFGLTRIGCNICPFASSWSEFLINKIYPEISKPYISVIEKMAWKI